MNERITGYSLLFVGILIMIFATSQIILVFTGKANPIPLFQMDETSTKSDSDNSFIQQLQNTAGINRQQTSLPSVQLINPELLNRMLNLTVYYLIMQFLLGLGYKFASLGTQLIRPIQVKMKNRILEQVEKTDT